TVVGTFSAGGPAAGLAFDGENLWVANGASDSVTKLRASDGAIGQRVFLDRFAHPSAVVFDGANIWAAGTSVFKVRASDGTILANPSIPGRGRKQGVAVGWANV